MSIVLQGSTSGSITLQEPAIAGSTVLSLPATSGTVLVGGTQNIPKTALPTGSVLQVVQTEKNDTFSASSSTFTDVTGLSVSITPTSATSKIFVLATTNIGGSAADQLTLRLVRNSTVIFAGNSAGSRQLGFFGWDMSYFAGTAVLPQTIVYLDSPATTSSTTYKIQGRTNGSSTWYVNRSGADEDQSYRTRTASSIIVMEIAA